MSDDAWTCEKRRRLYYQHIVYQVCNSLDAIFGKRIGHGEGVVCGTAETPTTQVEDLLPEVERRCIEWARQNNTKTVPVVPLPKASVKKETIRIILAWCDRSGEEPEGHCLHEIENAWEEILSTQPAEMDFSKLNEGIEKSDDSGYAWFEPKEETSSEMMKRLHKISTLSAGRSHYDTPIHHCKVLYCIHLLAIGKKIDEWPRCGHGVDYGDACKMCEQAYQDAVQCNLGRWV